MTPKAEQANPPLEAIPEPYLMQDTEDRVFQGILDLLNVNGLTAPRARSLLGKLHLLIDLGEQLGRKTTPLSTLPFRTSTHSVLNYAA